MAASKKRKPCGVPLEKDRWGEVIHDGALCTYLRAPLSQKCQWHWLLRQPISVQITSADARLKSYKADGLPVRARVPDSEWPAGERWCSGCQSFVPLFYVQGSRCKACASRANHASHVKRTYGITEEEYQKLLDFQGGVCYICRQRPRSKRLAVDHNHETGEVRGLLCANDEWGCNVSLRRLLNDLEMARRALEYVELSPFKRMGGVQAEESLVEVLETWDPWAA